ncbi:MAG: CHAP domain-containing protein [Anaerolineae bacterium]
MKKALYVLLAGAVFTFAVLIPHDGARSSLGTPSGGRVQPVVTDVPVPEGWTRYADAGLGITWACPASWQRFALLSPEDDTTIRTIVFRQEEAPGAILYVTAQAGALAASGFDAKVGNATVAGVAALATSEEGIHNPPTRTITFKLHGRRVTLDLAYDEGFDAMLFDTIVATIAPMADAQVSSAFDPVDTLATTWIPCEPGCGLRGQTASWCDLAVPVAEWDGVNVYSNGGRMGNVCNDYYGLKFQCVELIQRFYWEHFGRDTGTGTPRWGVAAAYQTWQDGKHPTSMERRPNNAGHTPAWGDILVWAPNASSSYGHVAVVTGVSEGRVHFVQQNTRNAAASLPFANGKIEDAALYGWLHYTGHDEREPRDTHPPDGGITGPAEGAVIRTGRVRLEGWATDGASGIDAARFYADWGEGFQPIGPSFSSSPFGFVWDLAAAGVPEGNVVVALDIWDKAGNVSYSPGGVRRFEVGTPPLPLSWRLIMPLLRGTRFDPLATPTPEMLP